MDIKRKNKAKLVIASIVLLSVVLVSIFLFSLDKAADEYSYGYVRNALTLKLNAVFADNLKKHSNEMQNAFVTEKENGDVKSVTVEMYELNGFVADMITSSALCIENARDSFSLPIGNMLGIKAFSGVGAKMKFTVLPVGSVSARIDSETVSSGINQNLYRVVIRINAAVRLLYPFGDNDIELSLEYVLCEILIVGKIPEFYFNFDATP